jgi:pSer/pThr/pTyr-binding forkhead associated (FHA) protein
MAALEVAGGTLAGKRFEVEGELTFGREGTDVLLDDPQVSRRHAMVRIGAGGLQVEDLGSSNGTFVNGTRIAGPTPLRPGDEVRLGDTMLRVASAPEAAPQPFQPAAAPPPQTFGAPTFAQRRRAPATRSLAHVYWTFGVIGVTALLLIVYFAAR